MARAGWGVDVIDAATWEEAPITFEAWRKQRTRWLKGHMQTWLVLMRNPGRTLNEIGLMPFLSMQLMLGGSVLAALLHAPLAALVLLSLVTPLDLLHTQDIVLALSGYVVAVYGGLCAAAYVQDARLVRAALTMPLYWLMAFIPALCAVWELAARPHFWAKTTHGVSARRDLRGAAAGLAHAV